MFCEKCGHKVKIEGKFCEKCGHKIKKLLLKETKSVSWKKNKFCENCGHTIQVKGKFCEVCGHRIVLKDKKVFPLIVLFILLFISFLPSLFLLRKDRKRPSWIQGTAREIVFIDYENMALYLTTPDRSNLRTVDSELYWIDPVWSPSGEKLLCLGSKSKWSPLCAFHEEDIYVYDRLTGILDVIGSGNLIRKISWSPDEEKIAFLQPGNDMNLWIAEPKMRRQENIMEDRSSEFDSPEGWHTRTFCWMPDSRHLLLARNESIWKVDVFGEDIRKILELDVNNMEVSPDGKRLSYTGDNNRIFGVVNLEEGYLNYVVFEKPESDEMYFFISDFSWNEKTGEVFYLLNTRLYGKKMGAVSFSDIWSYSPEGSVKKHIISLDEFGEGYNTLQVSPDGKSIALLSCQSIRGGPVISTDIWVIDIEKKVMDKIIEGGYRVDW